VEVKTTSPENNRAVVPLRRTQKPEELLTHLRKVALKDVKVGDLMELKNHREMYDECERILLQELDRFGTTAEEDKRLLDENVAKGRYRIAVTFRHLRKRILKLNAAFCAEMARVVDSLDPSLPTGKLQLKLRNLESDAVKRILLGSMDTKC
jgi:hypothetical protein